MKKLFFMLTIIITAHTHAAEKGHLISQNPAQQKHLHKIIQQNTNWSRMPIYQYNSDNHRIINKSYISHNTEDKADPILINDLQKAMIEKKVIFCTFNNGFNAILYNTNNSNLCSLVEEYEKIRDNFDHAFPGMG